MRNWKSVEISGDASKYMAFLGTSANGVYLFTSDGTCSGGGGGGGGGGATALSGLTDVDTTGVADGNCLVYNNTSGKWEDGACGAGGDDLGNHTATQDLDLATHALVNGGRIVLNSTAGGQPQGLGGGSLPACNEGEGLIYTSGAWACSPQAPDSFGFTDVTNQTISTLITSNSVNITGITGSVAVSVSGQGSPQIRINGGSWVTSGTITNGQSLEVQLTSSSSNSTMYSATVTVGANSDQWDVTTVPACGGVQVGVYCWYAGGYKGDCDAACTGHGGCDLTGTKDYAGSSGTNTQCKNVLDALGGLGSGSVTNANLGRGEGCAYDSSTRYRDTSATTCAASAAADTAPAPVLTSASFPFRLSAPCVRAPRAHRDNPLCQNHFSLVLARYTAIYLGRINDYINIDLLIW